MSILYMCLVVCLCVTLTESTELCTKISACSCKNSEGVIDLSPLAKSDGPAFKDLPDPANAFDYSWNPCKPFTEGTCTGAAVFHPEHLLSLTEIADFKIPLGIPLGMPAKYLVGPKFYTGNLPDTDPLLSSNWKGKMVFNTKDGYRWGCQKDTQGAFYYTIGTQDTAQFINDATAGLQIQYTSADRTFYVTLKCQKEGKDKMDVKGEDPKGSKLYYMTLTSVYACPGKGGGGGGGSFSIGFIIVIIFFGCFILYFISGVVFQKFVRKASGAELIPNHNFWSSLIGSIHAGVMFVFRRGKDRRVYTQI